MSLKSSTMAYNCSPAWVITALDTLEHQNKADLYAHAGHWSVQIVHAGLHVSFSVHEQHSFVPVECSIREQRIYATALKQQRIR